MGNSEFQLLGVKPKELPLCHENPSETRSFGYLDTYQNG